MSTKSQSPLHAVTREIVTSLRDTAGGLSAASASLLSLNCLPPGRSRFWLKTARESSDMLQELSHMDRITQLQDEIQQVGQCPWFASHLVSTMSTAPYDNVK